MKSRAFLISSILVISCLSALPCGEIGYYVEPDGHWIFYIGYDRANENWQQNLNAAFRAENIDFWYNRVHKAVSKEEVETALYNVYLLNSHTTSPFFRYLIDHKDQEALQYWMLLKASDSASVEAVRWEESVWFYDEKEGERTWYWWDEEKKPVRDLSIFGVGTLDENAFLKCKDADIRNRFVLQLMRKYFYNHNFEGCIALWEKYGKNVPKSVLRKQCINYYGGALRRVDCDAEAAAAYATIGYYNPTLHYDVDVLRDIYQQDPNSEGFEFMVQEFVNTYFDHVYLHHHQSPIYYYYDLPKYRLPESAKSLAFNKLSDEILKEGKTRNPALWKSAQAALAYIDGDLEAALTLNKQAEKMKGSKEVKENIRMMRLMLNSLRSDIDNKYEETLLPDLKWLVDKLNEDNPSSYFSDGYYGELEKPSAPEHRVKVLRRTIQLGIIPHFNRVKMPYKCMAYQNLYDETVADYKQQRAFSRAGKFRRGINRYGDATYIHPPIYYEREFDEDCDPHDLCEPVTKVLADSTFWHLNFDYQTSFFALIDTAEMQDLMRYVQFLKSGGRTPAEKFVIQHNYRDLSFYYELIATKYMRMEKYDSALVYLRKMEPYFPETQNIAEYISSAYNPFAEDWITNKEHRAKYHLSINPAKEYAAQPSKVTFCQLMLKLRKLMKTSKSEEERANAAYAYSVGLFRSTIGGAWALCYYENGYNGGEHWYRGVPNDERIQQSVYGRVNATLDLAMKESRDNLLTLKCKVLHSERQKPLLDTVSQGDYFSYTVFNQSVRNTLCDLACDYDRSEENRDWRWSAWYY